jgi:ABC-type sugar transport system ATPase subunit
VSRALVGSRPAEPISADLYVTARLEPRPPATIPLEVRDLSSTRAFQNVSFSLHSGEILGMFGLLGAGHLQVTRALFGIRRLTAGEVFVQGERTRIDSPRSARRYGIGLVSEDRKMEAIVPMMSVADNLMYSHWPAVARGGVISLRNQTARAKDWVHKLGVRVKSGVQQPIATLSGGNQQKVILARWLEAGVKILLLNEPTRGVDVGARSDIYTVIDQLRQDGLAVIVCSSDLEEILEVSDRVLVFARGQIVSEFARSSATEENLLAAAAG